MVSINERGTPRSGQPRREGWLTGIEQLVVDLEEKSMSVRRLFSQ